MDDFEERVQRLIAEIKSHTFFNPTYDAVFKRIFSKDSTLIHFLNAMLHFEGENRIESIERRKPSVALTSKIGHKEIRFDVHAKLANGRFVDLEMQRASHEDFLDRVELYASQLAINSKIDFDKGRAQDEKDNHPYQMPYAYSIWLCNFDVPFCKTYREEFGVFRFSDIGKKGALPVYDKKKYLFIDLTKYTPTNENTSEALWLKLFTQMANALEAPKSCDEVIADVYNRMRIKNSPDNMITEIAAGMIAEEEISTRLGTARREGREEGRKEGRKEGLKEGKKEGRREMILNILRKGKAPKKIAEFLEIPLTEVLAAQK